MHDAFQRVCRMRAAGVHGQFKEIPHLYLFPPTPYRLKGGTHIEHILISGWVFSQSQSDMTAHPATGFNHTSNELCFCVFIHSLGGQLTAEGLWQVAGSIFCDFYFSVDSNFSFPGSD